MPKTKTMTFPPHCIPGSSAICFLAAEVFTEPRLPFALVRYSLRGEEQEYRLRLDLDKQVFLDHLDEEQLEIVIQKAAPEIIQYLAGVQALRVAPLHDRVLVRRLEEKEIAKCGIIIPDTPKEKTQHGEVIAVGSGKLKKGERIPLDVEPGDSVV